MISFHIPKVNTFQLPLEFYINNSMLIHDIANRFLVIQFAKFKLSFKSYMMNYRVYGISNALFVRNTINYKEGCSIESTTPVNTSSLLLSHVLFTMNQLLTCHITNKYNGHYNFCDIATKIIIKIQ